MTQHILRLVSLSVWLAVFAFGIVSAKSPVEKPVTSPNVVVTKQADTKPVEASVPKKTPVQPVQPEQPLQAPTAGERIDWSVVSGGGITSSSASYVLTGTADQTAVGTSSSTQFQLIHGFWQEFPDGCCVGVTGNVDLAGIIDLTDLSALVQYLTGMGYVLPCPGEANVDTTGIIDLTDLSALISYLSNSGYVLPNCP